MKNYAISFSTMNNTTLTPQMSVIKNLLDNLNYDFTDKTVFCDCDEDIGNDFAEYFFLRFNKLNLRKLNAVCYLPIETSPRLRPHLIEVNEMPDITAFKNLSGLDLVVRICDELKKNPENSVVLKDSGYFHQFDKVDETLKLLDGGIDFRSLEYTSLLEQSDILFGNAPILLFDEYMEKISNKKSLIFSLLDQEPKGWKKKETGYSYWNRVASNTNWSDILTDKNGDKWMQIGEPCVYRNF